MFRILPQLCVSYRILSSTLGSLTRASTALGCAVVHDDGTGAQEQRDWWRAIHRGRVLRVLRAELHHSNYHGGCLCHGKLDLPCSPNQTHTHTHPPRSGRTRRYANSRHSCTPSVSPGSNPSQSSPSLRDGRLRRSPSSRCWRSRMS